MKALYLIGSYVFAATLIFRNSSSVQAKSSVENNLIGEGECTDCPAAMQEMQQTSMQQMQLENWMINENFWTLEVDATQNDYAPEQEEHLEAWMVEENFLGFFGEHEKEQGIEPWMIDAEFWQISTESYVDMPEQKNYQPLENWMVDKGFWTL